MPQRRKTKTLSEIAGLKMIQKYSQPRRKFLPIPKLTGDLQQALELRGGGEGYRNRNLPGWRRRLLGIVK